LFTDIYLDNNATTRMRETVKKRLFELVSEPLGNPSSPHSWGSRSRELIEASRSTLASFLGCLEEQVFFTSCASESNTMVFRSFSPRTRKDSKVRVITTEIEHPSIIKNAELLAAEGADVVFLPVNSAGLLKQEALEEALSRKTDLVSIQWVNNETGVVQDIPGLSRLAKKHGAFFHSDAVQAVGKMPIDLGSLPVDFLSLTGHKLHAPQGIGVLVAKQPRFVMPLVLGGEQEKELRAGTENLLGIAALGYSLEERQKYFEVHVRAMRAMRDRFESLVLEGYKGAIVNGSVEARAVNTSNLQFPGIDGRALTALLDQEGVICSQSSACTSSIPEPSYVLRAMGLSEEEAYSSIRFSFSVENTFVEATTAAHIVVKTALKLRATTAAYAF
jgi:cysteine desulfurase